MRKIIFIILILLMAPTGIAHALTLSPPRVLLSAEAGSETASVIRLFNELSVPVRLISKVQNFAAEGETGAPRFLPLNNQNDGLAQWVSLDKTDFVLAPGEESVVRFTISVPQETTAGGYYGAVLWSMQPVGDDTQGVNIVGETGSLVLLTVSGALREEMRLTEFSSGAQSHDALPVIFTVRLENTGTVHVIPEGTVEISNVFGKNVASLPLNAFRGTVLPSSVRRFNLRWEKQPEAPASAPSLSREWNNFAFGRYTARLAATYGSEHTPINAEISFWVLPWRMMSLLAGAIVVLLLGGIVGVRGYNRRSKNRNIKKQF